MYECELRLWSAIEKDGGSEFWVTGTAYEDQRANPVADGTEITFHVTSIHNRIAVADNGDKFWLN